MVHRRFGSVGIASPMLSIAGDGGTSHPPFTGSPLLLLLCTETGASPAERQTRLNHRPTTRKPRPSSSNTVVSFKELNSRKVDPSVVRQSVVHYLANPERLTTMQFANLGMASSRHCDIHLAIEVCNQVRGKLGLQGPRPRRGRGWRRTGGGRVITGGGSYQEKTMRQPGKHWEKCL